MAGRLHTVLLVEWHDLLRAGLRALIDAEPGLRVVGQLAAAGEAAEACARLQPDLVVIDPAGSSEAGAAVIRAIRRSSPAARVLVLGSGHMPDPARQALLAGALGFVSKEASAQQLLSGLRRVLAGEAFVSTGVTSPGTDAFPLRGPAPATAPVAAAQLTAREGEVMCLVAQGRTSRQIASQLGVSVKTVETHRMNMMRKLDLHKASEVTAYAISRGLVDGASGFARDSSAASPGLALAR